MRYNIAIGFLIILSQLTYSQRSEKRITAAVFCNDFALKGIEIINLNTKTFAVSNNKGVFFIEAKITDKLMFVSKVYFYKTITLKQADFDNSNFIVYLTKKPEELDEVVVFKMPNLKLSKDQKYEQGKVDELALEKAAKHPKPLGVYDGTLVNSPDLMRICGMILSLFIKEKEKTKKVPEIKFKTLVSSNLNQDFFSKNLLLKPEETALFLEFCDADPKSKTVIESNNVLALMDFLFKKNVAFKKLQQTN